MSKWRALADEALREKDTRDNRDERGASVPSVSSVSSLDPASVLREWCAQLARLDPCQPPNGFTMARWHALCDDAWWISENFGLQLAREGWSALDIFGVLPWRPNGGVLLDRLQGARNLKLDGEGRAFWSSFGVTFQTSRGIGEGLVSSGLVLIWELDHGQAE